MLTSTEVSLAQAQRQKFVSEEVCFGDDLSEGVCAESREGDRQYVNEHTTDWMLGAQSPGNTAEMVHR